MVRAARTWPAWTVFLAAAALGLAAFGWILRFELVWADAAYWRNPRTDMLAMQGGFEAFLQAPWRFPLTLVDTLVGRPVSIVYTDSIPWLAVLLKATGADALSLLGLFLVAAYPLQGLGMVCLLRALGVERPVPLLMGAALALLFPPWLARQFGHVALSGHWILLFTLAVTVSSLRRGLSWRRMALFGLLAALATGIHAYHLVPIGACFAAALVSEAAQRRPGALRRGGLAIVLVGLAVGASALVLGYDRGRGPTGGGDALGVYAMNLLGPFLPAGSRLFGQVWTGGWFTRVVDPTGAQYFEGLQYLGAGAWVLVLLALIVSLRSWISARPEPRALLRWAPLAAAMVGLAAWSVGWEPYLGERHLASLPRPSGPLAELLGAFRAHGRFFWTVGYLLIALGVLWASRLRPLAGGALLAAAVALQAWDLGPMRQGLREAYSLLEAQYPPSLHDHPALRERSWLFTPTYFCTRSTSDQRAIAELARLGVRLGGVSNTYPTARSNDPPCGQAIPGVGNDAPPGDRRIVVVTSDGRSEGGALQQVAWRTDCYRFARGVICGWGLQGLSGLNPVAPGELLAETKREVLTVRMDEGVKPSVLAQGWAEPDPGGKGIWSLGPRAVLRLEAPARAAEGGGLLLELRAIGFSDAPLRPQSVFVSVDGRRAAHLWVDPRDFDVYRVAVPDEAAEDARLEVVFDLPDARSSRADPRVLGIALQSVTMLKTQPSAAGLAARNTQ